MTMFDYARRPILIGYAETPADGPVSVWLDPTSATPRKVYIATEPVRYDDTGVPIGLRPAPKDIVVAAGYGDGVKLEAMRDARKGVLWRDA